MATAERRLHSFLASAGKELTCAACVPEWIVGAGPSGLLLSHLLSLQGVESIVVERRSREYVEQRVRAGLLEQGTVDLLREAGLADRLDREGLVHEGFELRFDGGRHRLPFTELTGWTTCMYGQQEVV